MIINASSDNLPLADSSIDAVVTDPPYGFKFMGKRWDYDVPTVELWQEVYRVTKPGAHMLAFGGPRTYHRAVCRIEDAGFEIRDCLMWLFGSGFPKSHNLDDEWEGWSTALKPAFEPIVLARKPLEGTVAENVSKWGVGVLNIDGCRIPANGDKLDGGRVSTTTEGWDRPWKHDAEAVTACRERGAEAVAKAEAMGRWPANIIHDGGDEVLEHFPDAPGQLRRSDDGQRTQGTCYGRISLNGKGYEPRGDSGSAARFFYCAKASKSERDAGLERLPVRTKVFNGQSGESSQDMKPVEKRFTTRARNHHPNVKPIALLRYLCRLITPPNGLILDTFCGSGSTGVAAEREGFRFVGIDLVGEYTEIARLRNEHEANRLPLFVGTSR
jgi:site-specific DNA-methyltransferase (adenine-specific)